MKNLEWLRYTYKHRRAFDYCVDKLIKEPALHSELKRRAKVHDMDKMIMYLFMDQKAAQELHVKTKAHHLENDVPKSYEDLVETVIDYECAPYTKPDKPLNAFDLTGLLVDYKVLDDEMAGRLYAIMKELGIDRSADLTQDTEGMEYVNAIDEITEEMILSDILFYINENRDNELTYIMELVNCL